MQLQAQCCRRRFECSFSAAIHKPGAAAGFGSELQASGFPIPDRRRPGEHGAERSAAERLFSRPQDVFSLLHLDDQQSFELHAMPAQCRSKRNVGRSDQRDMTAAAGNACQCRHQQAQLSDPRNRRQQFDDRASLPAAARQHGIQLQPATCFDSRRGNSAAVSAQPCEVLQCFRAVHHDSSRHCSRTTSHSYRRAKAVRSTPVPSPSITSSCSRKSNSSGA
jgi:hypothetical protein